MLSAVTGTYRNGKVDLKEWPIGIEDGAEVVVTFLPPPGEETSGPLPSLRGAWAGKVPENYDLDAVLQEVRGEWQKEWESEEIV